MLSMYDGQGVNLTEENIRMWDMAFVNNVTASMVKIWLSYSLSFLCQIVPELCKLGINLISYPCGILASFQTVNNRSLFQDMVLLVSTVKEHKSSWQVRVRLNSKRRAWYNTQSNTLTFTCEHFS